MAYVPRVARFSLISSIFFTPSRMWEKKKGPETRPFRGVLNDKSTEFLRSIAAELKLGPETSATQIVHAYLKNYDRHIEMLEKQIERSGAVNRIIIVGETGAGKSSLVNLLAENKVARVSDGAKGCTFDFDTYQVDYQGEVFELIDTIGLNEGSKGNIQAKDALKKLIGFMEGNKRGFSCVLFVMPKGRITDSFEKNHILFRTKLLEDKIPSILFVGRCEFDNPMDTWIKDEDNQRTLKDYGFSTIVCGTAQDGDRFQFMFQSLRHETRECLWQSIVARMRETPQSMEFTISGFKRVWNYCCDFFGFPYKFLSDRHEDMLKFLNKLGVDQEAIEDFRKYYEKSQQNI